ncbi:MAG: hypothetical protein K2Y37_25825, partial [Pirellulales bacterium]|nr:hypothetical protein [Pirellulales bacterium]
MEHFTAIAAEAVFIARRAMSPGGEQIAHQSTSGMVFAPSNQHAVEDRQEHNFTEESIAMKTQAGLVSLGFLLLGAGIASALAFQQPPRRRPSAPPPAPAAAPDAVQA